MVHTVNGCRISQSVKRIVVTSSGAAILSDIPTPSTFSELDWNEQCLEIVREKGREAPNMMKYRASKTLAEKGAVTAWLCSCLSSTNAHILLQRPGSSGMNIKPKPAGISAFLIHHMSADFLFQE
jgi:hypothetical protein